MPEMSSETIEKLLQQNREETHRRLDKVDESLSKIYSVLDRFLVVDEKVVNLESQNLVQQEQINEIIKQQEVEKYRTSWGDRVSQGAIIAACGAIITIVSKFVVGW